MTFKRLVVSAIVLMAASYVAYPYVTLYRLANAVSTGDSGTLATLVSWDSVRDGVKEDICDAITEVPAAEATKEGSLPPFGYSFVRGIAANVIDANINPEAFVSASHSQHSALIDESGSMALRWAFFDSPSEFSVVVGIHPQIGPDSEMRVQMVLRHGTWMVTRAWLPAPMLVAANSRT